MLWTKLCPKIWKVQGHATTLEQERLSGVCLCLQFYAKTAHTRKWWVGGKLGPDWLLFGRFVTRFRSRLFGTIVPEMIFHVFKDFAFARNWVACWMGKMVCTFAYKVHETKWTACQSSTVPQTSQQSLLHPNLRLSRLANCVCLGKICEETSVSFLVFRFISWILITIGFRIRIF